MSIGNLSFLKKISVPKEKPLGQQIKERREALGISQRDLAQRVGIAQPSLSSIESGNSVPRNTTLFALARELNDEFGSEAALKYLVGRTAWDREIRPMLMAIQQNDLYLDLVIYRLARMSERFRNMMKPDPLAEAMKRGANLVDMLGQAVAEPEEDVRIEPAEMMLAPVVAHIGSEDPKDKVRGMLVSDEGIEEMQKRLKVRKRKRA